jgi:hypothetical protein
MEKKILKVVPTSVIPFVVPKLACVVRVICETGEHLSATIREIFVNENKLRATDQQFIIVPQYGIVSGNYTNDFILPSIFNRDGFDDLFHKSKGQNIQTIILTHIGHEAGLHMENAGGKNTYASIIKNSYWKIRDTLEYKFNRPPLNLPPQQPSVPMNSSGHQKYHHLSCSCSRLNSSIMRYEAGANPRDSAFSSDMVVSPSSHESPKNTDFGILPEHHDNFRFSQETNIVIFIGEETHVATIEQKLTDANEPVTFVHIKIPDTIAKPILGTEPYSLKAYDGFFKSAGRYIQYGSTSSFSNSEAVPLVGVKRTVPDMKCSIVEQKHSAPDVKQRNALHDRELILRSASNSDNPSYSNAEDIRGCIANFFDDINLDTKASIEIIVQKLDSLIAKLERRKETLSFFINEETQVTREQLINADILQQLIDIL